MRALLLTCATIALCASPATAQSPLEIISRTPCSSIDKTTLPTVFDPRGKEPDDDNPNYKTGFGLRYFDWDSRTVQALRQRIRTCNINDPDGFISAVFEHNFSKRLDRIREEKLNFEKRTALAGRLSQAITSISIDDPVEAEIKVASIREQVERGRLLTNDRSALLNRLIDLEGAVDEAKRQAEEDAEAERKVAAIEAEARAKQQEAASEEDAIARRKTAAREAEQRASERSRNHDQRMAAQKEREARLAAALKARDEADARGKLAKAQNSSSAQIESKALDSERLLAEAEEAQKRSADAIEHELNASSACRRSRELRDNAKNIIDDIVKVAAEVNAGMISQACGRAKKLYLQAEEMRSTFAECNPELAFGPNQMVIAIKDLADEQECKW